jgi:hypothetical protein
MEKVIQEWRVVETDDGFRIEIKGDKEAMRGWLKRFARRAPRHHWGPHWMPFGPRHAHFWRHGFDCWPEDEPEIDDEKA